MPASGLTGDATVSLCLTVSKVIGVHHIAVRAADFDRSMKFYSETLGLRTKMSWTTPNGRAAFVEIAAGSYMEIFERSESFTGKPPILHFCLRTDDVDGMSERARADGHRVTMEPQDLDVSSDIGTVRLRLAFIEGPDGEEIELMASDAI